MLNSLRRLEADGAWTRFCAQAPHRVIKMLDLDSLKVEVKRSNNTLRGHSHCLAISMISKFHHKHVYVYKQTPTTIDHKIARNTQAVRSENRSLRSLTHVSTRR